METNTLDMHNHDAKTEASKNLNEKKSDPASVFFKKNKVKGDVFYQKELLLIAFFGFLVTIVCMLFY